MFLDVYAHYIYIYMGKYIYIYIYITHIHDSRWFSFKPTLHFVVD